MDHVDIIALLATLQLVFFSLLVGRARTTYGVVAPAVSGHQMFERAYRVQMNTLEQFVAFVPGLFLAAKYWPPALIASVGAVYLLGRFIYWRSYLVAPETRRLGMALTILPTIGLLLAALAGAVQRGLK